MAGHQRHRYPEVCTIDTCPIELSVYGYRPSLGGTIFLIIIFSILTIGHVAIGWKYRTWTFMIAMGLGCMWEAIGYGGRYLLHQDPFSDPGFKLQIVLLTFAPAFLAAGIYLMLKHLVITFGPQYSRLRPARYTHIFITCDFVSLALQGTGGGLASAGENGSTLLDAGNNLMIAGLVFQVFTLAVFALLVLEYFLRVWKNRHNLNPDTYEFRRTKRFRGFLAALALAWLFIFIRCVYRVIELVGGWGNSIMQDEPLFIVCDSIMCVLASALLLVFHPGFCFNYRVMTKRATAEKNGSEASTPSESVAI
jgi:hypothetical protein